MKIWSSMKIMKKKPQGTQIDGPIFAGENTLLCLFSSLSEYIKQIRKVKLSTLSEVRASSKAHKMK